MYVCVHGKRWGVDIDRLLMELMLKLSEIVFFVYMEATFVSPLNETR